MLGQGAIRVGFANAETLSGGPAYTDITYKLPEAKSAICFAMPLNKSVIRSYLAKELPYGRSNYEKDQFDIHIKIYRISKEITHLLEEKGFKAVPLFPNNKYREDIPGWRMVLMPELSLRYVAVRSGVASFGWSGNVGIKGYGTTIILGGLVTSAELEPTDPIPPEESFCNKCKLCAKVCGYQMFSDKEDFSFTLGGHTFSYANRIDKKRCILVCGGFNGLHHSRKFSTWSPGRYEYPENEEEVLRLMNHAVRIRAKWPKIPDGSVGYTPSSGIGHDIQLSCGNCANICFGDPKETAKNYKILTNSGCVVQKENGEIMVLPAEEAENAFKAMNPKHQRLYTTDYKKGIKTKRQKVREDIQEENGVKSL